MLLYDCAIFNISMFLSRGMTVTSGSVIIKKDQTNLIGISIGGGAPYCPCLYIVQVSIVTLDNVIVLILFNIVGF